MKKHELFTLRFPHSWTCEQARAWFKDHPFHLDNFWDGGDHIVWVRLDWKGKTDA